MTHMGGPGREPLPLGKTARCHLKGQEWAGGASGLRWPVRYSQCLVGAVLGLEEAHDEESHGLQAQHQHHAADEAGPVKARAVGFGDRTPCRAEVTAGHRGPGPQACPRHPLEPPSSLWGPEQQAVAGTGPLLRP